MNSATYDRAHERRLPFSFAEVQEDARLGIDFQRTLRIPHDDSAIPLARVPCGPQSLFPTAREAGAALCSTRCS